MGASVSSLMVLLSRDFIKLVLGAFVVTAPVAYVVMEAWLNDYTYRVEQGLWVFVLAGLAAVVIAWLTVSYQAFRAATVNPVKALRTE